MGLSPMILEKFCKNSLHFETFCSIERYRQVGQLNKNNIFPSHSNCIFQLKPLKKNIYIHFNLN